jgi:hypothetical protein
VTIYRWEAGELGLMTVKSYLNKTFLVQDPEARIRQPGNLLKYILYGASDSLPAGKKVGDPKVIPQGTAVRVINAKSIDSKLTFVLAEAVDDSAQLLCWTSADNLAGRFLNETIG